MSNECYLSKVEKQHLCCSTIHRCRSPPWEVHNGSSWWFVLTTSSLSILTTFPTMMPCSAVVEERQEARRRQKPVERLWIFETVDLRYNMFPLCLCVKAYSCFSWCLSILLELGAVVTGVLKAISVSKVTMGKRWIIVPKSNQRDGVRTCCVHPHCPLTADLPSSQFWASNSTWPTCSNTFLNQYTINSSIVDSYIPFSFLILMELIAVDGIWWHLLHFDCIDKV